MSACRRLSYRKGKKQINDERDNISGQVITAKAFEKLGRCLHTLDSSIFSPENIKPAIASRLSDASCNPANSNKVQGGACTPLPPSPIPQPSKAKKQSPAQYFFPLPAIRPSLKDSLSCSCSYYIVFRSPAPKTRPCGQAKHPSGGDITCATTGASNPITASSRGTTGDAP